jgi:hypothetical protein
MARCIHRLQLSMPCSCCHCLQPCSVCVLYRQAMFANSSSTAIQQDSKQELRATRAPSKAARMHAEQPPPTVAMAVCSCCHCCCCCVSCCRDMEPFLPGIADDFDDYLAKMAQPGVWGGE